MLSISRFCSGWLLTLSLLIAAPTPTQAGESDETLTVGIFAYRPADQMASMWEPTARHVESVLKNRRVELRILNQQEMAAAIGQGELDVVFTNPTHYIRLRAANRLSGAVATQVTIENGVAVSELGGVVIRRKDRADINTLTDLRGKRVGIPGREYLGGYVAQAALLKERGIPLSAIDFVALGNPHDKVIEAVIHGQVDAGFVRTGILEALRSQGSRVTDQLEVVEPQSFAGFPFATTTPLYPEWAVVAMPHLDDNTARRLAAALLTMEHTDPAARAAGIYGFTIPENYRPVEEAMVALRAPPFEMAPEVSTGEFVEQHQLIFLAVSSALLVLVSGGIVFVTLNRRLSASKAQTEELNQQFQSLSDSVPGVIYQYTLRPDGTSHFPWSSGKMKDIYGCTPEEVQNDATAVFAVIHPDDMPHVRQTITESANRLSVWHSTYRVNHPVHGVLWMEGSASPSRQNDGSITWHGFIRDITDIQQARESLKLAAEVLAATTDGVVILDREARVESVNPAFERLTGFSNASLLGSSLDTLSAAGAALVPLTDQPWRGDRRWQTASGKVIPVLVSISPVVNEAGGLVHHVVIANDITALKARQDELDRMANYDLLTGLPNRRMLTDRLEQAVAHARRTGEKLAIAMLDLDGFKPVNDRYGHEAGDLLLAEVARRLLAAMRTEDTVARLGGDEFTFVFRNAQGQAAFERILDTVHQPVQLPYGKVQVSASMGVSYLNTKDPLTGEQLMRQADLALYQSKQAGRNRYTVFQ